MDIYSASRLQESDKIQATRKLLAQERGVMTPAEIKSVLSGHWPSTTACCRSGFLLSCLGMTPCIRCIVAGYALGLDL